MAQDIDDNKWHLDKKVPLALMFTIACQTSAIVWWAAGINARVEQLEKQLQLAAPHAERIIRLEEKVTTIRDGIEDIKKLLRPNASR